MTSLVNTMTFHRQHPVASRCLETRPLLSKENRKTELGVFSVSPLWRSYLYNWKLNHDICINTDQLFNLLSRVRKWVREMVGRGDGLEINIIHSADAPYWPRKWERKFFTAQNFLNLNFKLCRTVAFHTHPLLSGSLLHDNISFPT